MTETLLRILKSIHEMDTEKMLDTIRMMTAEFSDLNECLDFMQLWYRDILMFKVTKDMNALIFRNEYSAISRICASSSYPGLEQVLDAIDKARVRLGANVNKELALELLFLTMKEN